jgi:hypothetical protein
MSSWLILSKALEKLVGYQVGRHDQDIYLQVTVNACDCYIFDTFGIKLMCKSRHQRDIIILTFIVN